MRSEILIKWLCIGLLCAALFGALGYGYGQMISIQKCNDYYENNMDSICNLNMLKDSQTISTDKSIFDPEKINLSQFNFTPIGVNK